MAASSQTHLSRYRASIEATTEWKPTNGIAETNGASIPRIGRIRANARGLHNLQATFITLIMLDRAGLRPALPWTVPSPPTPSVVPELGRAERGRPTHIFTTASADATIGRRVSPGHLGACHLPQRHASMESMAPPYTLDLWVALLAGESAWRETNHKPAQREQAVASAMLATLGVTLLLQAGAASARVMEDGRLSRLEEYLIVSGVASVIATALLAVRPVRLVSGRTGATAPVPIAAAYRALSYIALAAGVAGALERWRALAAVPIGLLAAADIVLTFWALGVRPRPRRWLRRFAFSTVHYGIVGALLATAVRSNSDSAIGLVGSLYVSMWCGLVVIVLAVAAMNRSSEAALETRRLEEAAIVDRERRMRAHWLHDDVLSEVRVATLRIDTDDATVDSTRRELQELDHRLRMRQLEESMRGGAPHVYEILQPHLRRAQSLGVHLDRVPPLDTTQLQVDEQVGTLINRAIANLMSNAINAGATAIGIAMQEVAEPHRLVIAISDDAGGFELDGPPGRGLHQLERDLGPGSIARFDVPGGSRMVATVPLGDASAPPPSDNNHATTTGAIT